MEAFNELRAAPETRRANSLTLKMREAGTHRGKEQDQVTTWKK